MGGREERVDILFLIVLYLLFSFMLWLLIYWGFVFDVGIIFLELVSCKNYKEFLENFKIFLFYFYFGLSGKFM